MCVKARRAPKGPCSGLRRSVRERLARLDSVSHG